MGLARIRRAKIQSSVGRRTSFQLLGASTAHVDGSCTAEVIEIPPNSDGRCRWRLPKARAKGKPRFSTSGPKRVDHTAHTRLSPPESLHRESRLKLIAV